MTRQVFGELREPDARRDTDGESVRARYGHVGRVTDKHGVRLREGVIDAGLAPIHLDGTRERICELVVGQIRKRIESQQALHDGGNRRRGCSGAELRTGGRSDHAGVVSGRAVTSGAGDRVDDGDTKPLAQPFVGHVEEGLVLLDRAPKCRSKTVALEWGCAREMVGRYRFVEVIGSIERAVAKVFEYFSVQLVRSGLAYDDDLRSTLIAVARVEGAGDDFELLDAGDTQSSTGFRCGTATARVRHIRSVQRVQVHAQLASVADEECAVQSTLRRAGGHIGVVNDAGLQECEVGIVTAIERQVPDAAFVDRETQRCIRGVYQRGFSGDRDLLARAAHRQHGVDHQLLRDLQIQSSLVLRPETFLFDLDDVMAGGEGWEPKRTVLAGSGRARVVRVGIDDGHLGLRDDRTGGVLHRSQDGSCGL